MARKKTPKSRVNIKASLSRRLREVRQELFGEHGGPELARRLGLPARTWYNYETGVTVPAEVLLGFIDHTAASPLWLLSGEGAKYRRNNEGDALLSDLCPIELIRRGLEKLEQAPADGRLLGPDQLPPEALTDFVAVSLVALEDLARSPQGDAPSEGYIMAYRQWLPHPQETVGVRLEDDAMHPILPAGSIVAVDRSVTDPSRLQGRIVAAAPECGPVIRWLDLSGKHLILRANAQDRSYPLIPLELGSFDERLILGQVVWSWSRFGLG